MRTRSLPRRWSGRLCVTLAVAVLLQPCAKSEPVNVSFAGFAYVGDDSAIASSYPNTQALEAERAGDVSVLDAALRQHVARVANPSFQLEFEQLASLKAGTGSAIVLAFALDRESVSVE